MLNVAIVGLGRWGQRLVDAVQTDGRPQGDRLRVTHAMARRPEDVAAYAMRQKLVVTDSWTRILEDPVIDGVLLATPHGIHAEQVMAAAAAGKHVFVEKPLALTAGEAWAAADAAERAGVVLAVGHNRRFLPAMTELKRMVAAGELGRLVHIEGNFSGPFGLDYRPGAWRVAEEGGHGGGMTAMGIHMLDAFINLCGRITWAAAEGQRRVLAVPLDDATAARLRFADGMTGHLVTIMATARVWRLQLFGTRGWVHLRDHHIFDHCSVGETSPRTTFYPATNIESLELEAFADAVAGRRQYPVPLDEVIEGVAALEAIIASAAAGGTPYQL